MFLDITSTAAEHEMKLVKINHRSRFFFLCLFIYLFIFGNEIINSKFEIWKGFLSLSCGVQVYNYVRMRQTAFQNFQGRIWFSKVEIPNFIGRLWQFGHFIYLPSQFWFMKKKNTKTERISWLAALLTFSKASQPASQPFYLCLYRTTCNGKRKEKRKERKKKGAAVLSPSYHNTQESKSKDTHTHTHTQRKRKRETERQRRRRIQERRRVFFFPGSLN